MKYTRDGFPTKAFGNDILILAFAIISLLTGCSRTDAPDPLDKSQWAGSQSCQTCHELQYSSYMKTGMGKSWMHYDPAEMAKILPKPVTVYHEPSDYFYEASLRNGKVVMREYRKERNNITHELEFTAAYQVGSGNNTISFIMDHNGYLFEMPLTWYTRKRIWDMSPGYLENNRRFFRPINETCMNCHNAISPVTPQTENHFKEVELGIACETCHGAGKQHVEVATNDKDNKEEIRSTIINSMHWDRELQMDLCQRCHLEGLTVWNDKQTADRVDYRKPLTAHKAVFVSNISDESTTEFSIASQADRLRKSECFKQSGTMTCTTCHDPHRTSTAMSAQEFNSTCQSCHKDAEKHTLCSFSETNNNCISCHMKVGGTSDIPHVLFTDHYIRRTIDDPPESAHTPPEAAPTLIPMLWSEKYPEQQLQKGLAYFQYFQTEYNAPEYVDSVIAFITSAARQGTQRSDGEDGYALSVAYLLKADFSNAAAAAERATARNANHARAWYILAEANTALGRTAAAINAYNKGIQAQPLLLENSLGLMRSHLAEKRYPEAIALGESILQKDSLTYPNAHFQLGEAYQLSGRLEPARSAYKRAISLDPDYIDARMGLGTAYLRDKQWARGLQEFDRILTSLPEYIPALMSKTIALANSGRRAEALSVVQKILQIDPNNENAKAMVRELFGGRN
ncbi:MAG: tetratricopeptide repeat protein [Ignavibacteriae bacterium]|nr:tetratricopeptide repeat protein [Ignavibacteriota bacterium]